MPTPQQVESLQALLDTRTPITLIETHDEARVLALFTAAPTPLTWRACSP